MRRTACFTTAFLLALAGPAPSADLASYEIVDGSVPEPLTEIPGDPARGRAIVRNPSNASCLICHAMPIPEEPDQGEIGPSLEGVADRYAPGELRLRLINPKQLNPDSVMPAYHVVEGLYRVQERYRGEPIYSAQEIEDVLALLLTFRSK